MKAPSSPQDAPAPAGAGVAATAGAEAATGRPGPAPAPAERWPGPGLALQWTKVSRQRTDLRPGARLAYPGRGPAPWGVAVAGGEGRTWVLVLSAAPAPFCARPQRVGGLGRA